MLNPPKFQLRDKVKRIGNDEVRIVAQVVVRADMETTYSIQLGADVSTRMWAKESELEKA